MWRGGTRVLHGIGCVVCRQNVSRTTVGTGFNRLSV